VDKSDKERPQLSLLQDLFQPLQKQSPLFRLAAKEKHSNKSKNTTKNK
jgi:hypothetical protein